VLIYSPRADPGFQVRRRAHLKKLRRAEGGANIFGVFRVKNPDFTPKNHIFSNFFLGRERPLLDLPLLSIIWQLLLSVKWRHMFSYEFKTGPIYGIETNIKTGNGWF
jgi:hypothetical protein